MRMILATLAVAFTLAVTEAPASASTLGPPTGDYYGTSTHHGSIFFHLSHDYRTVVNFTIRGHIYLRQAHFELGSHTYGTFNTSQNGMHFWGHWSGEHYGHVNGGYSYTHNGHHYTVHWTAVAHGY